MLAGLPWVTREFDTGSFRCTWVQSISPRRWLLGTFGTRAQARAAVAAWIEDYSTVRRHSACGRLPPAARELAAGQEAA